MATPINNAAWVQWISALMGGTSRQAYAATFPPDRFYCVLDELPLHLIPVRTRKALCPADRLQERLFLEAGCSICDEGQLPGELAQQKELLSGFALQGTIAWLRQRGSTLPLPFWLGPGLQEMLRGVHPGEPAPSTIGEEARSLLGACILTPHRDSASVFEQRDAEVAKSASTFREREYAPIGKLIHPFHLAALRRYYRHLIRRGLVQLGDPQCPQRYVAYNEPVARFFHQQIAPLVSAVAGEPVRPSYVYLASYLSGAELRKHTDREQCEISVTLCLDFSPEPVLETPWPICLDTQHGTTTVYQALGDGLVYRGMRLPHYRPTLGEGQTSTSIFFHYVPADFEGPLA